jgi:hypothetical protein
MSAKPVPLYERLPEIYRIKDAEQSPPDQLRAYLAPIEDVLGVVHGNIRRLYRDIFIESCDPWVIPYIGALLGTTPLDGDPWTMRADVADTIALRRRKGTIGAVELLAFNLTKWGAHCVELRDSLAWHQHLNHQRPDAGGAPPYANGTRNTVVRGGTVTLRDPALLSLAGTPFDPYAYRADVRPPAPGGLRVNLPNLAVFLWRLRAFRIRASMPVARGTVAAGAPLPGEASVAARFDIHPLGWPVRLFNTPRYSPARRPPVVTQVDETPGPIPPARLTTPATGPAATIDAAGNPAAYVSVHTYDETSATLADLDVSEVGLQLHLPASFAGETWTFRGANLCAWETPLRPPLRDREVAIDPVIGRAVLGLASPAEAAEATRDLLITYTYGTAGEVGAHPVSRPPSPARWNGETTHTPPPVRLRENVNALRDALANLHTATLPVVVEIDDSFVHDLDIATVAGAAGGALRLNRTLIVRATSGNRPIVRLAAPLRFCPANVVGATAQQQKEFDAVIAGLTVRLEGLHLTRGPGFPAGEALVGRAAVNRLEITGCTLDPDGHLRLDGTRAPFASSLDLRTGYGFTVPAEETAFKETPDVVIDGSVVGPLRIDSPYTLSLARSILDAGKGVGADGSNAFALTAASDPLGGWGPPTEVSGITVFGRIRVERASGRGGIFVHRLEVLDNQKGCLKLSYFSGQNDRLPQTFACVRPPAPLLLTSEVFGQPGYAQLSLASDFRIRERGPGDDQMGAFGFLLEAHRWRNLQIRVREFTPVGVRPLFVPVT